MKNNVGVWASSDMVTRFLPAGHHPEARDEKIVDRTKPVVEGLGHTVDAYEYHYRARLTKLAWKQSDELLATTTISIAQPAGRTLG